MTDSVAPRSDLPGTGPTLREGLFLAALLAVFAPAIASMASIWSTFDYLSHGYLVPVVSLWAFLREQPLRAGVPIRPDRLGALWIGLALLLYLAGLAARVVSLQGLALVLAIAGGVWFLRGPRWLRAAAFPVGFLIFMVPPPSAWITPLIVKLQVFVSSAAVAVLHGLGVTIARNGNVLALASGESLFVAEACSGVTSVITLTPLAVVLAAYVLRGFRARALLVVGVIPLAMAGNLARVVATVLIADARSVTFATEGPLHDLLGLSTYVIACLGMLGLAALLRRGEARG